MATALVPVRDNAQMVAVARLHARVKMTLVQHIAVLSVMETKLVVDIVIVIMLVVLIVLLRQHVLVMVIVLLLV
jgi:hypothetical protein